MSAEVQQWSQGVSPALVVLTAGSERPVWDSELSAMLESIEDRLEDVHVTTAEVRGRGPTLTDAAAAVRFTGAASAVVVFPREWPRTAVGDLGAVAGDQPVSLIPSPCAFTVDGIVAAYEHSCALATDLHSIAAGG
jgi:hypothetical protein